MQDEAVKRSDKSDRSIARWTIPVFSEDRVGRSMGMWRLTSAILVNQNSPISARSHCQIGNTIKVHLGDPRLIPICRSNIRRIISRV